MKIERITVCNIASLQGTHSVDFTKDPLRTAGLFSISGATGAGKSTLLDALCLALFDQTPRLNQVGRLAELTNGERQNDTRMLLRRNTAYGFAEVAFVGVDQQQWTARWSVRRSHNKPDGKLQQVEMALFRGHIAPGGEGIVAEGGKKTLVKDAIVEKIGLTFEQFTRAVLLAQNDFATFLKADDRQRAEILQALTGTEHFEAISRAVFARCADEKKCMETLEAQLQGYQPLTAEARTEADEAALLAARRVQQIDVNLKLQEAHAHWFRQHAKLLADGRTAQADSTAAVERRDAAVDRRTELTLTDTISREARTLRDAETRAVKDVDVAKAALETAEKTRDLHADTLANVTERLATARTALLHVQQAQTAAEPLLKKARELDAQLEPLQARVRKADAALSIARTAVQEATKKRDDAATRKQTLMAEQQTLLLRLDKLAAFVPFVKESATWRYRLDTAIAADSQAVELRDALHSLADRFQKERQQQDLRRDEVSLMQQQAEAASSALRAAEAMEQTFDAEQLAQQRGQLEAAHRALTTLLQQLSERQKCRDEAEFIGKEVAELESQQSQHAATLKHLHDADVPGAIRDLQVAQEQFDFMQAAIDDQAKRLRLSLQADHPCPVCGSEAHPYRDRAPDMEATAVKAAKDHLKKLANRREKLNSDLQRLMLSTQSGSEQIAKQQKTRTALLKAVEDAVFSSASHPAVATVLALPKDQWYTAGVQTLEAVEQSRLQVTANEKALRDATQLTRERRKLAEEISRRLQTLKSDFTNLEKQHSVTQERYSAAELSWKNSEGQLRDATSALGGLFSVLPSAKEDFTASAAVFREAFAASTRTCADIQEQLTGLSSRILEAGATVAPLEEALQTATHVLTNCDTEQTAAVGERDQHLNQRRQLFDGQAADAVEQEFSTRLQSVKKTAEELATEKHEAENRLAAATETLRGATEICQHSASGLNTAQTAMAAWLVAFNEHAPRPLSIQNVDQMLARGADWFHAEREHLRQLDERVTATNSACSVYNEQLQQHVDQRPTTEAEDVVLETVQTIQYELRLAKTDQETAQDIIRNDDRQRQQNADLTQRLEDQQIVAEPWLKLNELIGSKEGDKFRMIAQRRTLDVLLGYANHQLNQLSARYRLERLPESLNLIVIDCDMGEERRSIHSLSGGESFLVSLTLALGLASLTSNRLRIESLFIDEGFGSLDLETLTTAMNALTHLEAQGRKVGVISHVTEMTDAIPVQIRIEKRRHGGASRIVIPGADPDWVNPKTDFEASSKTSSTKSEDSGEAKAAAAATILKILERERQLGNQKVSTTALRKEIGCKVKAFASAQTLLDGQIIVDGRSLRLAEM